MQNKNCDTPTSPFSSLAGLPFTNLGGFADQLTPYLYRTSGSFDAGLPENSGCDTSLFSSQEQLNFFASNLLSEYPTSSAPVLSSPVATPLYDPLIGFYFPQTYPPLFATPSSPQSTSMSDYVHFPSSPAPTPASNSDSTSSPLLAPLPEPANSSDSKLAKEPSEKSGKKLTSYKRPREQSPLIEDDDIVNDPLRPGEDMAARKRRQNTMAARRSRMRKVARMEELEKTVSELEKDKIQLQTRLAVLESEKEYTARRDKENQDRIRALEAQLLEAYKNLPRS